MLTIEPPFYAIRGLTIFRDHADADQFYLLPGLPQLTSFALYKYRVSISPDGAGDPTRAPGAGMALFDVEVPQPNMTAIQAELASASGRQNARIAPVMCSSAEVHAIIAKADGDKLFDDLIETHAAPLVPPYHTAFALALSAEGATLMEQAATPHADGAAVLPVGVVYELRFLALAPSLHARVTMNYEEAYKRFSASLGFTYYYVKAALDLDIAWLVQHEFIKIEIISFTDTDDEQRQRAQVMNLVTARIQTDFFRSGLPQAADSPAPSGPLASLLNTGTSGSSVSSSSALFVLKASAEVQDQLKTFVLTFDGRSAIELTHTSAAHLDTLARGVTPSIQAIDTHDPFFSRLSVKVLSVVDFAALDDLRDAVVDLSYGDVHESYAIDAQAGGPFTFAAALADPSADQYGYRVTYDFDTTLGQGAARLATAALTSRSRVLVVDPLLHFRYRRVVFTPAALDPAQVPRLHVRARVPGADPAAPDVARDEFTLAPQGADHVLRIHAPIDAPPIRVLARTSWEDPHGTRHDGDEVEVTSDTLLVLGPYADVIPLFVSPAVDWTRVSQVIVEVRYQDGAYIVDKTATFTPNARGGQRVDIPLLDATKRTYSWRQTVFLLDGTSPQTPFADADASVLAPPWQKPTTADLHVVWVGPQEGILGLRVDVWTPDADGGERQSSAFLRAGGSGDQMLTVPLDPAGALTYRYRASTIAAAGETLVRAADAQSSPLLVIQTS